MQHTERQTEPDTWAFTDANFASIAEIAKTSYGLNLSPSKTALIRSRLGQRMKKLGLSNFDGYLSYLHGPNAAEERENLLSVLTTNVTHFFRESHHFDHLRETILPPLLKAAQNGQRVRFWSAGCSKGPEAYSLAMIILDMCPEAGNLDLKILATDIDPMVIETAKAAEFPDKELDGVPQDLRAKFVRASDQPGIGKIADEAQSLIKFAVLNLIKPLPFNGPFDVILCRNVAIYFDSETQSRVWHTFAEVLANDGHLFVGHSEHLVGTAKAYFRKVGFTTYQRMGA